MMVELTERYGWHEKSILLVWCFVTCCCALISILFRHGDWGSQQARRWSPGSPLHHRQVRGAGAPHRRWHEIAALAPEAAAYIPPFTPRWHFCGTIFARRRGFRDKYLQSLLHKLLSNKHSGKRCLREA